LRKGWDFQQNIIAEVDAEINEMDMAEGVANVEIKG